MREHTNPERSVSGHSVNSVSGTWHAYLAAWPGLLTLLSVLAVALGMPVQVQDAGPRLSATAVVPALPELRAAPQPTPAPPVFPAPPPQPYRPLISRVLLAPVWWHWTEPPLDLGHWLTGRRQTDGG